MTFVTNIKSFLRDFSAIIPSLKTPWLRGRARQHSGIMLTIATVSLIIYPRDLHSQTSTNVPLILASGVQSAPALVSDGRDGAFVIWHDKRDNRTAIYAQRLNALGQPQWKQDGILLAASTKDQLALTASPDGKNGVWVFWQDLRNDTGDIYGQRLDPNGNLLWSAAGTEVNRAAGKQSEPRAVSDGEGGAFIVWRDYKLGHEDIAVQRIDGNGEILLESAGRTVVQGLGNQTLGDVVPTHDGGFIAVWTDNSLLLGSPRVAVQRFNAKANPLWKDNSFVTTTRSAQDSPVAYFAATNNTDGNVFVIWSDDRNRNDDIFAQKIDATGAIQWGVSGVTVCKASNSQTNPQIIGDSGDGILAVWEDQRSGKMDIYAQAINAAGQIRWQNDGAIIVATSQEQTQPQIIPDGDGGLICVWNDERNSGTNIVAQRLDKNGKALWEANGIFITPEGGTKAHPAILTSPNNPRENFVVWEDSRRGNEDIFAQLLNSDGTLANVPPLITSAPPTEAQAGALYNYQVKAQDYDSSDPLRLDLVAPLGKWLQVDSGKLQLFGTPGLSDAGEIAVTIAVKDKPGAQVLQSFTLKVVVSNRPPQITSKPDTIATEDLPYNYQIVASDPDPGETLTYALETDAAWLRLNTGNKISGTPTNEQVGNYAVLIRVTDKLGFVTTQKYSLLVKNVNDPPLFVSKPDTVATEEQLYAYQFTAVDPDPNDAITYSLQGDAPWLKLTADTKLTGTPTNEQVGTYSVTLRATDKQNVLTTQKFSLRVKNVNDPPFFTSQPDTVAAVDSLYFYRPTVADVDRGEILQIIKRAAPEWLNWNSNTYTLQGRPPASQLGNVQSINLQVRDAAGVAVDQNFRLRVISLAPADVTAPAAPQALQVEPASWNANKKFTLRWQNPFDPSRVTGAYYKIGAAPAHNQDGVFVASPDGVTLEQLELLASREGKTPVYLWLTDGRGNVDFRTAVNALYRYDATPPTSPQNLSPHLQWNRGDSLQIKWTPATDTMSGIKRYHFFLDGKFFGFVNGTASNFPLVLRLSEGAHGWTFMAEDSAGNLGPWMAASFKVDRTPPILLHTAADTALAATELVLSGQASDALSKIREVVLYYRAAGTSTYRNKNIQPLNPAASFSIRLEAAAIPTPGLEYFFEAADSAGNRARWPSDNFQSLQVSSANVAAPLPFVAKRYQLFSVPYLLFNDAPAQILEDDLGSYDPTRWRLFRYQSGEGNVEFGKPAFENLAPGRAFWLITTTPQNFDAGPARSIRTDTPFVLKLQPGWNLIATPFDFPTAWATVQKPASVENNLWAFDGTQYLDQQNSLLPWQGYFLRNLDSQAQTIHLAPALESGASKTLTPAAAINWQIQLRVSDGEFSDATNYLGEALQAEANWDPLDWSEPPTIGDHVSLYFNHSAWPRFAGKFTRDFRPAGNKAQSWPFEVVASRPGLPVELRWTLSGDFPAEAEIVLQDIDGHLRREIRSAELSGEASYTFRATAQPRHFIWWVGEKAQLAEAGALQNLIPAGFELAPSYPNPLRLAELPQIGVIRFGLPSAGTVRLTIFDLAGRIVRTLVNKENLNAGYHEARWNGRDDLGQPVTAGIYLYRLEAANFSASHKLILLR